MTNKNTEFSQGVCQDGAAILKDGQMMTIEEILAHLRYHHRMREALKSVDWDKAADWGIVDMDGRDNALALLNELDNLKNGS